MRKSFVLFLLMLTLAVACLPWAHTQVDKQKNAVELYEKTQWGDVSAAEGLAIEATTHMDHHLFWKTDFWPATDAEPATDFTFAQQERIDIQENRPQLSVELVSGNFGVSGAIDLEAERRQTNDYGTRMLWEPVVDVASRTENGQRHTETVPLRKYYDHYPMTLSFDLGDGEWLMDDRNMGKSETLTEYFAIPVPEEQMLTVTVEKNRDGTVISVESQCQDAAGAWFPDGIGLEGVMTQQGGYFVISQNLSGQERYAEVVNSPRLAEDYGIYYFPLQWRQEEWGRLYEPDLAGLCNVFPIKKGADALHLFYDSDEDELLLLTEEENHLWVTVIQRKTMKQLQRLELGESEGNEYVSAAIVKSRLAAIALEGEYDEAAETQPLRMVLLERKDQGWSVELHAPLTWDDGEGGQSRFGINDLTELAYDGTRLAVVQWEEYRDSCDVWVLICREGSLDYAGVYSRPDTYGGKRRYDDRIRPWYGDGGLCAAWNEKQ